METHEADPNEYQIALKGLVMSEGLMTGDSAIVWYYLNYFPLKKILLLNIILLKEAVLTWPIYACTKFMRNQLNQSSLKITEQRRHNFRESVMLQLFHIIDIPLVD